MGVGVDEGATLGAFDSAVGLRADGGASVAR
jgi:hypothetical protein